MPDEAPWATPSSTVVDPAPADVVEGAEELHHRVGDGIEVRLFWHPETGATWIRLVDGERVHSFPVDPKKALDAFHHPFTYER